MTTDTDLFVDAPAAPPPIIVDRSTLERWATCPHQAFHVDDCNVSTGSTDADVGSVAHEIIAAAVKARHEDVARPDQLRELMQVAAVNSRPDIQPAVMDAVRRSYAIAELLCRHDDGQERSSEDLLRYDGGEGDHAGQLASDLIPAADDGSRGPLRLTAELDLLLATVSAEEVEIVDWKAGRTHWTATDVRESFQFQFYAWLVFRCYRNVRRVRVRVFMTREAAATGAVEFLISDYHEIERRLLSAALLFLKYRDAGNPEQVPAWPAPEKCSLCPAATRCVKAHSPAVDLARDPEAYLRQYVVFDAAAAQMKAQLTRKVRQGGRDLRYDTVGFGVDKPVKSAGKAKPCDLYDVAEAGGTLD